MQVQVRRELETDQDAIFNLNVAAFEQDNEAKLVDLLRKSDSFIPELSLVAEYDDIITGHILFPRIKIIDQDSSSTESLALAPMAVLPQYQKTGIGKQLVETGLDIAKTLGYESVIVLGHAEYYPRFGFTQAIDFNIVCPFDVPLNVFMVKELKHGALSNSSGIVEYPKEFEMV